MPPGQPTPMPALCRLCRRPIPRAVAKCPYCGARRFWNDRAGRPQRLGWPSVIYAAGVAGLVVVAILWFWVLREAKSPLRSGEVAKPGRPSAAECAELMAELARASGDQHVTPELRERFRQCLERR